MSFQAPLRLIGAARPTVPIALLVAIATSTAVFAATPFLLAPVAEEFGVAVGTAGLMSTAQLGGFVVASWAGGRFLRPVRSVFIVGSTLGAAANLASAGAPTFELLCALRFLSGLSLGLAAWIAWQAAFGDTRKTGQVAVVGPLVGVITTPVVVLLLDVAGLRLVFLVFGVLTTLPLLFARQLPTVDPLRPHQTRHAPTRAARVVLFALCLLTLGGSAVFVYAAAIGTDLDGLSPLTVSLLFSANAIAGIPSARWTGRRGPAGMWFLVIAMCAFALAASRTPWIFAAAIIAWGGVFLIATPASFQLLASRSSFPEERAGDAQAMMALGRVFGPLVGGILFAAGSTTTLGIAASGLIAFAGCLMLYVDRERFVVSRQFGRRTTTSVDAPQHA